MVNWTSKIDDSCLNMDWFVHMNLISHYLPKMVIKIHEVDSIKVLDFDVKLPGNNYVFKMRILYKPIFKGNIQQIQPILLCLNEDVVREIDNHISKAGIICYFFPGDLTCKSAISCLYCIQCAIKWCDCYNFWLKNKLGGWPCKEMPHGSYYASVFNILRPSL